jgi:hypothetical protein
LRRCADFSLLESVGAPQTLQTLTHFDGGSANQGAIEQWKKLLDIVLSLKDELQEGVVLCETNHHESSMHA